MLIEEAISDLSNENGLCVDLGEIVKEKFAFDVVGHYSRPEVLSLIVRDHPTKPVTFASSSSSETKGSQKP